MYIKRGKRAFSQTFVKSLYRDLLQAYPVNKWIQVPGIRAAQQLTSETTNKLYGDHVFVWTGGWSRNAWEWYCCSDRKLIQFRKLWTLGYVELRQRKPGHRIYMKIRAPSPEEIIEIL